MFGFFFEFGVIAVSSIIFFFYCHGYLCVSLTLLFLKSLSKSPLTPLTRTFNNCSTVKNPFNIVLDSGQWTANQTKYGIWRCYSDLCVTLFVVHYFGHFVANLISQNVYISNGFSFSFNLQYSFILCSLLASWFQL